MRHIIGIDLGGTNLRIGLFKENLSLERKEVFSTKNFKNKIELIEGIIESIEKIINYSRIKKQSILGVGLGVPGPVDYKKQLVYFFPNIKGWHNVYLGRILKKRLEMNVYIDNDTNLICLAEAKLGTAKGFKNIVCVSLGTGVGGGLIIENQLYRGTDYVAGEIGHIPISEDGPICGCGKRGCLESYVGNRRIIEKAKKVFKRNISLEELSNLAKLNNKKAIKVWQDVGEKLGMALAGIVNLLNPQAVVIAGGVSKAGKVLFDSIKKNIKKRAMPIQAKKVKVLESYLKDDAGITGAALLVKEEVGC